MSRKSKKNAEELTEGQAMAYGAIAATILLWPLAPLSTVLGAWAGHKLRRLDEKSTRKSRI